MRIKVAATYSFAAVSHFPPFIFMEMNRGSYGIRIGGEIFGMLLYFALIGYLQTSNRTDLV